jgi:peptidoglycan/LPS O-acetylase OafA/YrhL
MPAALIVASANMSKLLLNNLSGARFAWVDVLRGVAVLLVLFRHIHLTKPKSAAGILYRTLYTLQTGGSFGVDLFFVISGFLVSGILFRQYVKTGQIQPLRFLIRRGFKIYPPFWVFIAATLLWVWIHERKLPLKNALVELAFVQSYWSGLYAHTWSLGVEEHCYVGLCLLLTLLAAVLPKRWNPFAIFPILAVTISLTALVMRSQDLSPITHANFLQRFTPTHLRCDAFLIGSLLGYYYYFTGGAFLSFCQRFKAVLFACGLFCMLPAFFVVMEVASGYKMLWFWLASPGAAMLLMSALGTRAPLGMMSRAVATIGKHSYSIYLWHILVGVIWLDLLFARMRIPVSVLTWVPAYFLVSISTGMLLTWLVEVPSLRIRDRWFPENLSLKSVPAVADSGEALRNEVKPAT